MKIGIDIDDTITDSWEYFMPYFSETFKIDMEVLKKSKPYYSALKEQISVFEYYKILLPFYDKHTPNVPLKPDVKEVIDKLYELGHTVTFITARGREHSDAYKQSKDYIDKHSIKYEKIIVGALNKAKVCKEEKIDIFIDDSIRHCHEVNDIGVEVLIFDTRYNQEEMTFKRVKKWEEVYEYIKSR